MNYSMTPRTKINLRSQPTTAGADIGDLLVGSIAEGDVLVGPVSAQWMEIKIIDGVQTTVPTYAAAWLCNLTANPPAPIYPDFSYDASTTSDQPIEVFYNDVSVGVFPAGTIRVVSKNPTLKLT